VTNVSFSDGSPTETVGYDANTNGMGRLTAFTDSAGGTEFFYNSLGQLVQETRTNSGMAALSTVYGYNSANADLNSITYPSGLVVSYGRDSNGRINAILADSALFIGSISYMPFGPAEDYDMMAGGAVMLHVDRTFNERYLPTRIQAGTVMDYQYKYYADGSVWQISGVPATTVNQGETDSYQVSGTNQLDFSVTDTNPPVQYGYDANGNTISDGSRTFTYDRHNRLIHISQGTETLAEYAYDIQGRRVKKTAGGLITYYVYDAGNNLIAEMAGDGTPLRDYIYLGSEPVAMKVYGTQAGIYYFLNDHLGTPQKIVDSTGAMVWEAAYLPFGQAQVLVATITNNLRFPGQYFDAETGLHYNWHRNYDPQTGRYLTPDPIGLDGGINLYAYVQNNPVNRIDPLGLYDLNFSAGFHVPVSPGIAVGPVFSSSIVNYSNSPNNSLSANPIETDVAAGVIADVGVSLGISDISATGGACAGNTLNLGTGRYAGAQITFRKTQDQTKSIFNPSRYIDGMSIGLGIGVATPVSVSRGLK